MYNLMQLEAAVDQFHIGLLCKDIDWETVPVLALWVPVAQIP